MGAGAPGSISAVLWANFLPLSVVLALGSFDSLFVYQAADLGSVAGPFMSWLNRPFLMWARNRREKGQPHTAVDCLSVLLSIFLVLYLILQ